MPPARHGPEVALQPRAVRRAPSRTAERSPTSTTPGLPSTARCSAPPRSPPPSASADIGHERGFCDVYRIPDLGRARGVFARSV